MSTLALRYKYDDVSLPPKQQRDDFGWLSLRVQTPRFSGVGGFWVQWQDVEEFGEALRAFPIAADKPVKATWGFNMGEGDDLVLSLEVAQCNRRGDVEVRFELADHDAPGNRVRGSFITHYANIDEFRMGIARVMDRKAEEAVLQGD